MDNKPYVTRIVLQQYSVSSSYSESEAAAASNLSIGTIRYLCTAGLIKGKGPGKERRYSEEDVARLRRIRRLQQDLGVNMAGVEIILHLLELLDATYRN
jgi:MerR family transcriptional regulator/heat shock protein HspR